MSVNKDEQTPQKDKDLKDKEFNKKLDKKK
jgi:hypothetical protein